MRSVESGRNRNQKFKMKFILAAIIIQLVSGSLLDFASPPAISAQDVLIFASDSKNAPQWAQPHFKINLVKFRNNCQNSPTVSVQLPWDLAMRVTNSGSEGVSFESADLTVSLMGKTILSKLTMAGSNLPANSMTLIKTALPIDFDIVLPTIAAMPCPVSDGQVIHALSKSESSTTSTKFIKGVLSQRCSFGSYLLNNSDMLYLQWNVTLNVGGVLASFVHPQPIGGQIAFNCP